MEFESGMLCAFNETKKVAVARSTRRASSLWSRCVGLLGTASLTDQQALWLTPCQSIHTLFMRFPIDVAFLDQNGIILAQQTLPPWRLSGWHRQARSVLELRAGLLQATQTQVGDRIIFKD
jgi:uncharacterized protein